MMGMKWRIWKEKIMLLLRIKIQVLLLDGYMRKENQGVGQVLARR